MRFNSQLSAVLAGQFLLEESAVAPFQLQAAQLLTATTGPGVGPGTELPAPPVCHVISPDATSVELRPYTSLDDVPAGSVAVHTISGVMMPDDSWDWDTGYCPGTRSLASRIQQADAHPNIVAHVGWFRTPGGSTMGLEHFADIIAGTTKPFVDFVEMMCSAGMWSGSGADRVVIARTGIAGSIGTKWDGMDFSGFYEKMGMKLVTVTATDSTDKTKAFDEALKGKPALLRTQLLDPLNDAFLATIRANRPGVSDDALTGKLYVGQLAIDAGLADELGSLQDAIQLALDLAEAGPVAGATSTTSSFSSTSTPNQPTMGLFTKNTTPAFAAVLALAGQSGLTASTTQAANEELAAAGVTDAALISQSEYRDLSTKAARAEAAETKATGLQATVDKLTTDLAASTKEVERLGALAGATPTTSGKTAGDNQEAPKTHAWFDAKAEHNLEAEKLLG
jgi:ClpP class serine protease